MIDFEKAKEEFIKYTSNYDSTNENIYRKIYHSFRVMELSTKIAQSLYLSEEEVDLATLIGLLHDIARFEQYRIYKTFSDRKSVDHGNLGVEILEKDNFIRKFIEDDKYDEIIKVAIKNHNKAQIEEGLEEPYLTYAKIIRDADKLDIFYEATEMFWKSKEEINEIENSEISKDYLEKIYDKEIIVKDTKKRSKVDSVVFVLTLIFNINFKFSFEYILNKNFINNIFDRFSYTSFEVRSQINEIKKVLLEYIEDKMKILD